jgi:hypothetical protein
MGFESRTKQNSELGSFSEILRTWKRSSPEKSRYVHKTCSKLINSKVAKSTRSETSLECEEKVSDIVYEKLVNEMTYLILQSPLVGNIEEKDVRHHVHAVRENIINLCPSTLSGAKGYHVRGAGGKDPEAGS